MQNAGTQKLRTYRKPKRLGTETGPKTYKGHKEDVKTGTIALSLDNANTSKRDIQRIDIT